MRWQWHSLVFQHRMTVIDLGVTSLEILIWHHQPSLKVPARLQFLRIRLYLRNSILILSSSSSIMSKELISSFLPHVNWKSNRGVFIKSASIIKNVFRSANTNHYIFVIIYSLIFKTVGIRRGFNDIKSLRSPPTTTNRAHMSILTIKDLTKTNLAGVRE